MSTEKPPHWLYPLLGDEPGASLLVGGVGHLLLNREEEAVVTAALEARVLPLLRDLAGSRPITFFTGLAPGADVLLQDRIAEWCRRNGVALIRIGICAVPLPLLVKDWISRAEQQGYTLSAADRLWVETSVQAAFSVCDEVVPLYAPGDEAKLADAAVRQQQYQRLAAVLAEHADVLLAVLNDELAALPGGTAEVVTWRQQPERIPLALRTRPRPLPVRPDADLIVIHPMPAKVTMRAAGGEVQVKKALARAQAAIDAGNDLLANDVLYRALQQGLQHRDLSYLRVRVLAGIGSSELALREYQALAPPAAERDERWVTLLGRIHKDRGLRKASRRDFSEAASAYLEAWSRFGSSYSLINAASTLTLAQDWPRAQGLAKRIAAVIATESHDSAEARYFAAATNAEAALILGDHACVKAHLVEADACLPPDAPQRSRTVRQLLSLCQALRVAPDLLQVLKLPPLILLRRLGAAQIEPRDTLHTAWIAGLPAHASVFCGICDRFDLQLAEALQQRGLKTHLVLPYRSDRVLEAARNRLGAHWMQRLDRCLARAAHVHAERGFLETELGWAASNVTERALGIALLMAERVGGELSIVDVDPQQLPPQLASAARFGEASTRATDALAHLDGREPPTPPPAGRRMVGLIFADFAGFQRLEDLDLPYFWEGLMRGIAQILQRHGEAILLRHTWGDALHVVTRTAHVAAEVMADIQHYIELHALKPGAPLAALTLRIAGHYAPAYEGHDPIHAARTYFGTQLSLTARIEPVTPPGQIYATEAFAARLAVEDRGQFTLEYTGEIELAKRFGAYRLYTLRRRRN